MKYGDLSAQSSDKHRLNCFLNQDYTGKAWKSWDCSAWRRKVQRTFIYKYFMEEIKRQSWTFLGSVQWVHKRWWASTEIQEILFKHEKKAFSLWEWPNSGTSCPERLFRPFELSKDTAGHNPEQPDFIYSALTREMNYFLSRGDFTLPWFCDAMKLQGILVPPQPSPAGVAAGRGLFNLGADVQTS